MSKLTACSANWLRPITCSTANIATFCQSAKDLRYLDGV